MAQHNLIYPFSPDFLDQMQTKKEKIIKRKDKIKKLKSLYQKLLLRQEEVFGLKEREMMKNDIFWKNYFANGERQFTFTYEESEMLLEILLSEYEDLTVFCFSGTGFRDLKKQILDV